MFITLNPKMTDIISIDTANTEMISQSPGAKIDRAIEAAEMTPALLDNPVIVSLFERSSILISSSAITWLSGIIEVMSHRNHL